MPFNAPQMHGEDNSSKIKRYVHSPLETSHQDITAKITENGKVVLTKPAGKGSDGSVEYDEIEIPASLVFKLAQLLKATRKIEYIDLPGSSSN